MILPLTKYVSVLCSPLWFLLMVMYFLFIKLAGEISDLNRFWCTIWETLFIGLKMDKSASDAVTNFDCGNSKWSASNEWCNQFFKLFWPKFWHCFVCIIGGHCLLGLQINKFASNEVTVVPRKVGRHCTDISNKLRSWFASGNLT